MASGAYDLSLQPLDGQNGATSPGSIAISAPTMSGNLATYAITVQMPLAVDQTITDPQFIARVRASGTLKAAGTFQFDFGPRTVYWEVASGDFAAGANWDTGFVPRTGDTAAIQNGGTATLSTALSGVPASVSIGGGAELILARSGGNALASASNITNHGTLRIQQLAGGNEEVVGRIAGNGTTNIEAGSQLTAGDIVQHSLIVGAGAGLSAASIQGDTLTIQAGAAVTIRPSTAAASAANDAQQVPEPSTVMLLLAGGTALLALRRSDLWSAAILRRLHGRNCGREVDHDGAARTFCWPLPHIALLAADGGREERPPPERDDPQAVAALIKGGADLSRDRQGNVFSVGFSRKRAPGTDNSPEGTSGHLDIVA